MKSSGDFPFIDTPHQFYKKILVPPPPPPMIFQKF